MNAKSEVRFVKRSLAKRRMIAGAGLGLALFAVSAGEGPDPVSDRLAIERVYYSRYPDPKPPFEEALPRDAAARLVREDQQKETVLKKVFSWEITPEQIRRETQRINSLQDARPLVAELKAALGRDPGRFERAVVRPSIVDRMLWQKYEGDEVFRTAPRREIEKLRTDLLQLRRSATNQLNSTNRPTAQSPAVSSPASNQVARLIALLQSNRSGELSEMTWIDDAGLSVTNPAAITNRAEPELPPGPVQLNTNGQPKLTFEMLPPPLQEVVRFYLREPGDVSTVIEGPGGYLLCVAREKTNEQIRATALVIGKRGYQDWLIEQLAKSQ